MGKPTMLLVWFHYSTNRSCNAWAILSPEDVGRGLQWLVYKTIVINTYFVSAMLDFVQSKTTFILLELLENSYSGTSKNNPLLPKQT